MRKDRIFSLGCLIVLGCCGYVPAMAQNKAREAIETPMVLTSQQKTADPSSIYLEAFQFSSAAERLIKSGDDKGALASMVKAESYLKVLTENYPNWRQNVVRYRRELNARTVAALQKRIQAKESLVPVDKQKFLDDSLEKIGPQSGAYTPSIGIRNQSERELALTKRLKEVLEELNQLRAHSQSTDEALKSSTRDNVAKEAQLKALESQLQELKNAPKSTHEQELEKELAELRKFKDANSSEREKKLEVELNALRAAAVENRGRKEEELQRQINILNKVVGDKTQRELDLQLQVTKLKNDQERVKTERELMLQQRLDETMAQLTAANATIERMAKDSGSGVAYERLNQDFRRSQAELAEVTKALKKTKGELNSISVEKVKAETSAEVYKNQLKSLRNKVEVEQSTNNKVLVQYNKDLTALEKKVKESEQQRAKAEAQLSQLNERMSQTEAQLSDVTKQRNEIQEERDQMAALMQLNNPEKTKALLEENLSLARQMKELQEKLTSYQGTSAQLDQTRTELAMVKQRMIELRDENTGYRKRISHMSEKLRSTDAALEKVVSQPNASEEVVTENKLLREAISKQLRALTVRANARELLVAAYERLNIQDPQMENAIKMLDGGVELTQEEKDLLDNQDKVRSSDAILVAPGNATPAERAKAFSQLMVEVDALGKGASDAYGKGRYAAAEQLYETLLDKHPGHYAAHVNLGVILLRLNRADDAQKVLQNAVDLDPDHPTGQFLLGVAQYRLGKDAGAQMALTAATMADPANAKAFCYLGMLASSARKTAVAMKHFQRALELDPSLSSEVYYNMSSAYLDAQKIQEARKCYDMAIRAGALPDPDLEKLLREAAPMPAPPVGEKKESKPEGDANTDGKTVSPEGKNVEAKPESTTAPSGASPSKKA